MTHHGKSTLHIYAEVSRNSHTKINTNKVTGFTLELSDLALSLTPELPELPELTRITQAISTDINDAVRDVSSIDRLKASAIEQSRIEPTY